MDDLPLDGSASDTDLFGTNIFGDELADVSVDDWDFDTDQMWGADEVDLPDPAPGDPDLDLLL